MMAGMLQAEVRDWFEETTPSLRSFVLGTPSIGADTSIASNG